MSHVIPQFHVFSRNFIKLSKKLSYCTFLFPAIYQLAEASEGVGGTRQLQATASQRAENYRGQRSNIRPSNFDLGNFPVNAQNAKHWQIVLYDAACVATKDDWFVQAAVVQIIERSLYSIRNQSEQQILMSAMRLATTLYLGKFPKADEIEREFLRITQKSPNETFVAIALSALDNGGKIGSAQMSSLLNAFYSRFPGWRGSTQLATTVEGILQRRGNGSFPDIKDLLRYRESKEPHLFVLCRPDRNVVCSTILRKPDGSFLREDNHIWMMSLRTSSIYGVAWNFSQGATPQGILRMEGLQHPQSQEFRAYGQFNEIVIFLPFESGPNRFLPWKSGSFRGDETEYQKMWPESWRSYRPIMQSYYAGKMGRSVLRIHGTGEALDGFAIKKGYSSGLEWNPALGCLSAREIYDDNGNPVKTDMRTLLKKLSQVQETPSPSGYVTVIDVPGDNRLPVSIAEIESFLE